MNLIIFTICALFGIASCEEEPGILVGTKYGNVRGLKSTSRNGREYTAFKGIQYGIVKKRFEEAVEPESWTGIKDALKFGNSCAQMNLFDLKAKPITNEEDCLFLNVYSPQASTKKMPVIFYIHGGAFIQGSGDLGEKYFMDEDVILVTMNYRLGAFGFLAVEGVPGAPDNLGFRDQLLALKWVKVNIPAFGGDPDRVTIMGESAGAGSVAHLLISPLTDGGLFHGAILQSGAILNNWVWTPIKKSEATAKRLGNFLGCDTSSNVKLLECLREKDVEEILRGQNSLVDFYVDPLVRVSPVAGNSDATAFVPGIPEDLIRAGKFHRVPTIFTVCEKEGLSLHAVKITKSEAHMKALDEDWVTNGAITAWLAQDGRLRDLNLAQKQKLMTAVRKHYFGNGKLKVNDPWTLNRLEEFYTDRYFFHGIRETARAMSQFTPVFLGMFTDVGADSLTNKLFGHNESLGVTHGDDLQFFFNAFGYGNFTLSEKLTEYSQNLIKIWVNFAKTGIPSGTVDGVEFQWAPVADEERTAKELVWLNLGQIPETIKNPYEDRVKFWDKVYTIYGHDNHGLDRDEL